MDDEVDVGPFVDAMDGAMVIVTAADAETGERSGCLVGFHSQCSIEPPRYLVWISRANHTFGVAQRATHLAVHLLPDDAAGRRLAEHFGGKTGDETDKFASVTVTAGPGGAPTLDALPWRLIGEIVDALDLGSGEEGADHVGFVLRPIELVEPDSDTSLLSLRSAEPIEPGHPAD